MRKQHNLLLRKITMSGDFATPTLQFSKGRFCLVQELDSKYGDEVPVFGYIGGEHISSITDSQLLQYCLESEKISFNLNSNNLPELNSEEYTIHSIGNYSIDNGVVILAPPSFDIYREDTPTNNSLLLGKKEIFMGESLEFKLQE
jgi:hypothetical protein